MDSKVHLVQELDGVRIIGNRTQDFLQKVPGIKNFDWANKKVDFEVLLQFLVGDSSDPNSSVTFELSYANHAKSSLKHECDITPFVMEKYMALIHSSILARCLYQVGFCSMVILIRENEKT